MIVILEGVDGSGKTTLALELHDRLGFPIYKPLGSPIEGGMSVRESQAADWASSRMALAMGGDLIMDRCFVSEWVYGKAYERGFDSLVSQTLDQMFADAGAVAFLLRLNDHWDMWGRADEHVKTPEQATKLIEEYDSYVTRSKMQWRVLDGTKDVLDNVEQVMLTMSEKRPDKGDVFMALARTVRCRSTCLSRRVGAVLVSSGGYVIATGQNGAPKGVPHQCECPRLRNRVASGTGLDACYDVHAEENCIIQAAIAGADPTGGTVWTTRSPCSRCMRMLINAGIERVVYDVKYEDEEAEKLARLGGLKVDPWHT